MGKRNKKGGRGAGGSNLPVENGEENGQQDYSLNQSDSSAESDIEEQLVDKRLGSFAKECPSNHC